MSENDFDVVIIGSGAGGGASAWALAKSGIKVLVIEAGPSYDPETDFYLNQDNWEQPFPKKMQDNDRYTFANGQPLSDRFDDLRSWNHLTGRYNNQEQRISFGYHRVMGVGGSSLHFTGEAHRLNPRSMQIKTDFNVGADWPLTYEELEPFYMKAEEAVGVAGSNDDRVHPRSRPYPQAAHELSYASKFLQKAGTQLGMTFIPNSLAVLSSPYKERPNCNYCGGCLRGCPRKDKGTIDITYLKEARETGLCTIRKNTTVTKIITDENNRVAGIQCSDGDESYFLKTKYLVLSGGAVESPRLLLNSSAEHSPYGLCNESGQVGQNFMETLLWTSSGLSPNNLGSHRGLPVDCISWDYNAPDAIEDVIGGCRFAPSLAESDLVGPIAYGRRVVGGWGYSHKERMKKHFGKMLSVSGIAECLPNSKSYISLERNREDRYGVPLAKISSYLDDMAIRRIAFMAKKCRSLLSVLNVEILEEFSSYDIFSSTHVFGTCRMGNDAKNSVVDAWCKSHRWQNLYIMDASVFPSSGGGESPGLTIQALALRASKRLAKVIQKD
ncbi:GMC family oxidoreductase [Kiloniella litopenaei]|uniref:GMC family oxidoreductase n=1 Tax=Kiloniella litopenaei TaxID=1549748 RepID=UPI003BAD9680